MPGYHVGFEAVKMRTGVLRSPSPTALLLLFSKDLVEHPKDVQAGVYQTVILSDSYGLLQAQGPVPCGQPPQFHSVFSLSDQIL